jgi:hypothetical protein
MNTETIKMQMNHRNFSPPVLRFCWEAKETQAQNRNMFLVLTLSYDQFQYIRMYMRIWHAY